MTAPLVRFEQIADLIQSGLMEYVFAHADNEEAARYEWVHIFNDISIGKDNFDNEGGLLAINDAQLPLPYIGHPFTPFMVNVPLDVIQRLEEKDKKESDECCMASLARMGMLKEDESRDFIPRFFKKEKIKQLINKYVSQPVKQASCIELLDVIFKVVKFATLPYKNHREIKEVKPNAATNVLVEFQIAIDTQVNIGLNDMLDFEEDFTQAQVNTLQRAVKTIDVMLNTLYTTLTYSNFEVWHLNPCVDLHMQKLDSLHKMQDKFKIAVSSLNTTTTWKYAVSIMALVLGGLALASGAGFIVLPFLAVTAGSSLAIGLLAGGALCAFSGFAFLAKKMIEKCCCSSEVETNDYQQVAQNNNPAREFIGDRSPKSREALVDPRAHSSFGGPFAISSSDKKPAAPNAKHVASNRI